MFSSSNRSFAPVSILPIASGGTRVEVARSDGATHALFMLREKSFGAWAADVSVGFEGVYRASGAPASTGPGSTRPTVDDVVVEMGSIMAGAQPVGGGTPPMLVAGTTGPSPMPPALILAPFGAFDRLRLWLAAGTAATEEGECAVALVKLGDDPVGDAAWVEYIEQRAALQFKGLAKA